MERYDPRTNEWIEVASMNQERADFSACVLDGCIVVAGGRGIRRYLNTCEKYDPSTNTWKYIAPLPQVNVYFLLLRKIDYNCLNYR